MSRYVLGALLLGALAGTSDCALGHGGQYRGPRDVSFGASSRSPQPQEELALCSWDFWWEFNRERFLHVKRPPLSAEMARQHILPLLLDVLEEGAGATRTRDEITAALIALAKLGLEPESSAERMIGFLPSSDQEISEAAVLSLGILGESDAVVALGEILFDDPRGRERLDRHEVSARHQAMAAFALGLIGSGEASARSVVLCGQIRTLLAERLYTVLTQGPDVHVACIIALGLVPGDEETVAALAEKVLLPILSDKKQPHIELIRAHIPTALMRLARRLPEESELRRSWIDLFLDLLENRRERARVRQSIVLALGEMITKGDSIAPVVVERLIELESDARTQQERFFTAIALGQIGSPASLAFLRRELEHGKRLYKPWVVLGLAIDGGSHGSGITDSMREVRSPEWKGAFAIALGILKHRDAAPLLLEEFRETNAESYKGYLGLALGLMGHREATGELRKAAAKSRRRPQQLQQLALALGMLGDERIAEQLLAMQRQARTTSVHAALGMGLGFLGDERAIEPLIALAQNREMSAEARAFAIVALGLIGDRAPVPWNARISENLNYRAATTTMTGAAVGVLDML